MRGDVSPLILASLLILLKGTIANNPSCLNSILSSFSVNPVNQLYPPIALHFLVLQSVSSPKSFC